MNNKNLQFLEKQITRKVGKAIEDYSLIEDGDRIMLAHSGGKDSWTLLHILKKLQKKAPVKFDIFVATVDPGFPGFQTKLISDYIKEYMKGQAYLINNSSIYQIIINHKTPKKSICSFCSRLRRGILYRLAREHRLNKIALAHHSDDFIETLLLNQFFVGRIKAMTPLLLADDGVNKVIRPLCYVEEEAIDRFSSSMCFPILEVNCPAKEEKQMKRKKIKNLISGLESQYPGVKSSLLSSLARVDTRHLMDKRYWKQ